MLKNKILAVLAIAVALPSAVSAGETTVSSGKEAKSLVEETKQSWITGDLGFNVVNQYVSHGFIFENQGFIIQPYADLYFKVYEGDGFLDKITLNLGIWNSIHSRHTDAGLVSGATSPQAKAWYEFDFTGGVSFTFAKYFTLTPSYTTYISPNDGFATFQGINVKLAVDDTELLKAFALHPAVTVLFELDNKVGGSSTNEGIYYELAIAPALPAFGPVTVSFPMVAGFGSGDFYDTNGFGYAQGGVAAAYAMTFIPAKLGTWTLSASANYLYLSDTLANYNTGPGRIRDNNHNEFIYQGGLAVAF